MPNERKRFRIWRDVPNAEFANPIWQTEIEKLEWLNLRERSSRREGFATIGGETLPGGVR
jgi:hypothetical protein